MATQQNEGVELLQREIERLTRELDQASSEKVQSAQYGLVLLEEKKELQQKCEEFENLYENAKHELTITQEVMCLFCKLIICSICNLWCGTKLKLQSSCAPNSTFLF